MITPKRSHPTGQSKTEIVKSSEYRHSSKKLVIIVPLLSIVLWRKKKNLIFVKDKTVDYAKMTMCSRYLIANSSRCTNIRRGLFSGSDKVSFNKNQGR